MSLLTARPERAGSSLALDEFPLRGRAWAEIGIALVSLVSLGLILGWLVVDFFGSSEFNGWDTDVGVWFEGRRSASWNALTDLGSGFSDTITMVILVVAVSALLAWLVRRWLEPTFLALALTLEATAFLLISTIVGRDRPPVEQLDASPPTASFPSGHTGAAVAFYLALAVIVWWNTDRAWLRWTALAAAMVIPVVVALSRVYRGMHYPSDVIVGGALGLATVAISAFIVNRAVSRRTEDLS